MGTWGVVGLIALVVAVDVAVMGAVFSMVGRPLKALAERYPAREPAADAVWKNFQSLRVGMSNWGGCVHVGVDAKYLHLQPAWLARRFGMKPMSWPWDDLKPESGQPSFNEKRRGLVKARLGEHDVAAPAWAMSMIASSEGKAESTPRVP